MRNLIVAFLRWVLGVLKPGTGKRRASSRPTDPAPVSAPPSPAPAPVAPRRAQAWPPAERSPYGLETPLCGEQVTLVRPYLVALERERARQYRRRVALVLAADWGIDLDRHVVGAEGVA